MVVRCLSRFWSVRGGLLLGFVVNRCREVRAVQYFGAAPRLRKFKRRSRVSQKSRCQKPTSDFSHVLMATGVDFAQHLVTILQNMKIGRTCES